MRRIEWKNGTGLLFREFKMEFGESADGEENNEGIFKLKSKRERERETRSEDIWEELNEELVQDFVVRELSREDVCGKSWRVK